MLNIKSKENLQVKTIINSNDFISFIDDVLVSEEELSFFDMSKVLGDSFLFPNISTHHFYQAPENDKEHEEFLISTYIENDRKPIAFSKEKRDVLLHFNDYLIKNHENLNEYTDVTAHTQEYNLLSYLIYRSLKKVHPRYAKEKEAFHVNSILESDLLYKISVRLPEYVYLQELTKYDYVFEEAFMNKHNQGIKDTEVRVVIDKVNENTVFTVSKFSNKTMVSFSDVLNFGMGYAYSDFSGEKYKSPLVIGLLDNETPKMLEYSVSKNIPIIGTQNKCPIAYSFAMNLVLTNHYEDLNFFICAPAENTFWKMFSRNPHVLGYHTEMDSFKNVINDIYDESVKRLQLSKKKKAKTFQELKTKVPYNLSQMTLIIEGVSKILTVHRTTLKNASEANYQMLMDMLNFIAEHSEKTGINIIGISERGDKTAYPQKIVENSLVKIAMSLSSENDINTLFGVDVVDLAQPIGLDYNIVEYEENTPRYCKTCTVGGLNSRQMLSIVRVVAFDWVRKTLYSDLNIIDQPMGLDMLFAYNRHEISKDSLSKLFNSQLIPSW